MDEETKQGEEKPEKKKDSENKQVFVIMIILIVILVSVIGIAIYYDNYVKSFNYINLNFKVNKLTGNSVLYSTSIPVTDNKGKVISSYNMSFRNNPKDLEYIEVEIPNNEVRFLRDDTVYIITDAEEKPCRESGLAAFNLAGYFSRFVLKDVKAGVTDLNFSEENNIDFVTCESEPYSTVLYIRSGNVTRIEKTSNNCYELTYSNCEITQVTEKFMLTSLKNYMDLVPKYKKYEPEL